MVSSSSARFATVTVFFVLVGAIITSSAASAQNQVNQATIGQTFSDTGTFSVKHTELGVVATNQNESSSPCLGWGSSECVAEGGLLGGQWFLLVELQLNAASKSTSAYVVSVQIDSDGPVLQPIEFTTTNSTVEGSAGDFCWDLGSSFSTPLAFTVTVADA